MQINPSMSIYCAVTGQTSAAGFGRQRRDAQQDESHGSGAHLQPLSELGVLPAADAAQESGGSQGTGSELRGG